MMRVVVVFIISLMLVSSVSAGTIKQDVANISGPDQIYTLFKVYNYLMVVRWNCRVYYLPRCAELAWREKTGDCTDRSTILAEMLRAHGMKAQVVTGITEDGTLHNWVRVTLDVDPTCPGCNRTYFHDGVW